MDKIVQLIVGLGNPGQQYEQTRHNAGASLISILSQQYVSDLKLEERFFGFIARVKIDIQDVRLLIPNTYMNLSGKSIAAFAKFYQISPENILVVHDDIDLAPGISKYKIGGGHGGHNGLKDTIRALGNNSNFARLRIGVGHPGESDEVVNFVLKKASQNEQRLINESIINCISTIPLAVTGKWNEAMKDLHTV
ncbi:MAG: aminoacyl-tRNA hydrolase [Cellvibrionales bacterium]|nr:aminoacyl-tRNA hydrolase [Cellvibrionales bacterium]MCH9797782.1 aminoacyl-tRNA hydrolase [Gammaproteobacteria bacterium]MDA7737510.1 aminoacyl-tRNA hydrolase [Porticoccus sp.]MCH9843740.1 aminoacyl-tRNA hydrolase [Gammaproteobacteria bacterium]MDC0411831.1 aminoacyl-tRNA hydrolase [Porticoccus sp.]